MVTFLRHHSTLRMQDSGHLVRFCTLQNIAHNHLHQNAIGRPRSPLNQRVATGQPKVSGDDLEVATPDPIPNSVVKHFGANGTAGVALWESRTSPGLFPPKNPYTKVYGFFAFVPCAPQQLPSLRRVNPSAPSEGHTHTADSPTPQTN